MLFSHTCNVLYIGVVPSDEIPASGCVIDLCRSLQYIIMSVIGSYPKPV